MAEGEITPISDIFDGGQSAEQSASTEDTPEEKDSAGEKPEGDQKYPEGSQAENKEDKEPEEKAKETEEKPEKTSETPDEKKGDQKADEKEKVPSQEKEKDKWESEDNPYQKRWKDTAANWNKEHQEKLALQQQVQQLAQHLEIQKKIADGTYDPERDNPANQVSTEDVATQALNVGKMLASRTAAIAAHGEEKVNQILTEFNQLFGENQVVQAVVLGSEAPVFEIFNVLDRYKFETKYGSKPGGWESKMREELKKELEPEIRKQVTAELMGRLDKKKNTPTGLSSRGSNGLGSSQNSKGKGQTPLNEIF